jgi:hypothetical protein
LNQNKNPNTTVRRGEPPPTGTGSKEAGSETETGSGSETETGSGSETETETGSETGSETEMEPETGSDPETETETGSEPDPEPRSPLPLAIENLLQLVRRCHLELVVPALGRRLVGPPALELGRVAEAIALHVIEGNLAHALDSERLPR